MPESQRVVPVGLLAEPVVGTVGWNGSGTSGIEYQYQSLLAGQAGTTDVLESPDGVALPSADQSTPARPGTGFELTLDESVQYVAEQALAAEIVASHATGGHGRGHGREDRRHPGHGQPDRHSTGIGRLASVRDPVQRATLTAEVGATPNTSGATLVAQSDTLPAGRRRGPLRLGGHPGLRARARCSSW